MINQFVEALCKLIRKDMNNYTDDMANGVCKSFDDYQKLCGVIQGLALAEQHVTDLAKRLENDDDE